MPEEHSHDPAWRHERAKKASAARHQPETLIRALGRASLTDAHKAAIAALIMPFLAAPATGSGEGQTAPGAEPAGAR